MVDALLFENRKEKPQRPVVSHRQFWRLIGLFGVSYCWHLRLSAGTEISTNLAAVYLAAYGDDAIHPDCAIQYVSCFCNLAATVIITIINLVTLRL